MWYPIGNIETQEGAELVDVAFGFEGNRILFQGGFIGPDNQVEKFKGHTSIREGRSLLDAEIFHLEDGFASLPDLDEMDQAVNTGRFVPGVDRYTWKAGMRFLTTEEQDIAQSILLHLDGIGDSNYRNGVAKIMYPQNPGEIAGQME